MSPRSSYTASSDNDSQSILLMHEKIDEPEELEVTNYNRTYVYRTWSPHANTLSKFLRSLRSATSCILHLSYRLLRHLTPSFLRCSCTVKSLQYVPHVTAFLDGMRGIAAFSVFLCHLSYETWDIQHTYGSGQRGENNWVLQLPFLRLLYSGPPMVAMFFVISGYALSYKPAMLTKDGLHKELFTVLSSSVFRRVFRLYFPCFVSTLTVVCIVQLGAYDRTASFAHNLRAFQEPHLEATETFRMHFYGWVRSMFNFINVFDWTPYAGTTHLDLHLWTIPIEYRCSLALFLTHLVTVRMYPTTRRLVLLVLICWGVYWDRWDMISFWSGHLLAESHHQAAEVRFQHHPSRIRAGEYTPLSVSTWLPVLHVMSLLIGCYLASFPDLDAHEAPGYMFLNSLIPYFWAEKHRFWPTVGAVIIVWSTENIPCLNRLLSTAAVQYLGKISFSLYVVHGPVIKTIGYMIMEFVYELIGVHDRRHLEISFVVAAIPIILLVVWTADIFWRTVDIPCVRLTRWLERKVLH